MSDYKWGYVDKTGKIVIEPQFDYTGDFRNGFACVGINKKYGIINKKGKFVAKPKFDYEIFLINGLAATKLNDKWGFINETGNFVINPQFDDTQFFNDNSNLAAVKINGKWGYIDRSGKFIINPRFDDASKYSEGLAAVKNNGKWGYIDKTGSFVIPPLYDDASSFYPKQFKGGAIVRIKGKAGIINKRGEFIISPMFDYIDSPLDNSGTSLIVVAKENKAEPIICNGKVCGYKRYYGLINDKGEIVLSLNHNAIYNVGEGLSFVLFNRTGLFIDNKTGKVAIEKLFGDSRPFINGLACVQDYSSVKYGFIDKTGKYVIVPQFEYAYDFQDNLAAVKINGKWGVIDNKGRYIIEPKFENIIGGGNLNQNFTQGIAWVMYNNKWGLINKTGKFVIYPLDSLPWNLCEGLASYAVIKTPSPYCIPTQPKETTAKAQNNSGGCLKGCLIIASIIILTTIIFIIYLANYSPSDLDYIINSIMQFLY